MDRQHQAPEHPKIDEGELRRFEQDFIAAVRRAGETVGRRQRQRSLLGRFIVGIAVAALLAGVVPPLLWQSQPEPEGEPRLVAVSTVQVCDRRTGRAVPGAEVVLRMRRPLAGGGGYGRAHAQPASSGIWPWTVAVTNAFGAFRLVRPERSDGYEYVVLLGGVEVARISADNLLSGKGPGIIWLEEDNVADSVSYPGRTRPEGPEVVGGGISLEPAPGTAAWEGVVYRDLVWPTVFNYGKVLDGIFRVSSAGDADRPVRMTVEVSRGKLMYFQAGPGDLRLIAFNEQYAREDDALRRFAHRGWYLADKPPQIIAGIKPTEYAVEPLEQGCSVSWLARPGWKYALLAVPRADNSNFMPSSVFRQSPNQGGNWSRQVVFGGSTLDQYRLFDTVLSHPELGEIVLNPLPQHPTLQFNLEGFNQTRGLDGGWPALVDERGNPQSPAAGDGSAQLRVRYYDFTVSEYAQSAPLDIELKPIKGDYRIDYDPATHMLELAGDLAEVVAPPDWDFYVNGTRDGRGFGVEIPVSPGQPVSAAATFFEDRGGQVRVEANWVQPADWLAGSCSGAPVLATRRAQPPAAGVTVQTPEVSFPPYPPGVFCGSTLGPLHLVEDAELAGQPLGSAEIVLYVTPLQGDTSLIDPVDNEYIYFDPLLAVVEADGELLGVPRFASQPAFPGHPDYHNLDLLNTSIDVYRALNAAASGGSAREYLGSHADEVRRSAFSIGLGLDLKSLPPEQELLPVLRRFARSEYYTIERITDERQQVSWTIDLTGVVLQPGQGLVAGGVIQTSGGLFNGQWELLSGEGCPSRITISTADGRTVERYFDFGPCGAGRGG